MINKFKLILILLYSIGIISPVTSEEVCTASTSESAETIVFSLDEPYQEQRYTDENGIVTTIRVMNSLEGEHRITMSNVYMSMAFTIKVNSYNHITSAYNPYYNVYTYNVQSAVLSVDSLMQATYTLSINYAGVFTQKYLRVNISSGTLNVTYN